MSSAGSSSSASHHAYLFGDREPSKHLRNVTLESVLAGGTCSPIGLADFEAYLSFVERSLENLQFVVWYQSYRQRYLTRSDSLHTHTPGANTPDLSFSVSHHLDIATIGQRIALTVNARTLRPSTSQTTMSDSIATCYDDPLWSPYDAPATPTSTGTAHSLFRLLKRDFKSPVSTTSSGSTIAQSQQPFRDECDCIIATFFAPNSRKELSLDSDVRDGVLYGLTTSTHPDIFLPAYEVIFYTLQTCSLPRFLACASAATNRPNQLLWFIWGLVCLCTSLVIYVTTLAFAPWDDFRSRALRLLCVFPAMVGTSFPYATSQGYCLNVSGRRKNMQLRPWELEGLGTPTREWWIDIISPIVVSHDNRDELEAQLEDTKNGNTGSGLSQKAMQDGAILPARLAEIAAHHARQRREAMLVDVSIIAPCVDHTIVRQESSSTLAPSLMDALPGSAFLADDRLAPSITNHKHVDSEAYTLHKMDDDLMTSASIAVSVKELTCSVGDTRHPHHNLRAGFPPPPIFGPEKVVLDPRIMAVHQTIMRKVLAIQIFTFVVFVLLCLAVPVVR